MDPITMMVYATLLSSGLGSGSSLLTQYMEHRQQDKLLDKQQQFSSEEADKAREWESYENQYNQMIELGFNPNLAASSLMGGNGELSSAPAYSPSPAVVPDVANTIGNLIGGSVNNIYQNMKQLSEIENTDSMTALNNMELGQRPLNYEEQRNLWRSQSNYYVANKGLAEANAKYVTEQAIWVGPLSSAKVQSLTSQAAKDKEMVVNFKEERKNLAKQREVMDSEIDVNIARAQQLGNEGYMQEQLGQEAAARNVSISMDNEVRQKFLNNFPLSMEFKERLYNMYMSDNPDDVKQADLMLDAVLSAGEKEYNQQVQNRWENFGKEFLMDLGDGVINAIPTLSGVGLYRGLGKYRPGKLGYKPSY